jgi:DNA-binding protein Alba
MAKKKEMDNQIMVGKKPTMNYVMAGILIFDSNMTCILKARGNAISKLFNITEILKRKFEKANYSSIDVSTDVISKEGKEYNVTSVEVKLSK